MSDRQLRIAAARLRVLRGWDLAGQLVTTCRCLPLARLILVVEPSWASVGLLYLLDFVIAPASNDGGGNGGGLQAAPASAAAPAQHVPAANGPTPANGGQQGQVGGFERGLDSGLAKAAPSAQGLTQKTYRSYRGRLDLFSRQCQRRSWCRHRGCLLDPLSVPRRGLGRNGEPGLYNDIELTDDHFKPITKVLDSLFQHEEEVELPERCQEFFEQFQRERQEELQAYLVRHQTMVKQLKDLLAGWHLLMQLASQDGFTHRCNRSAMVS